ncbi:hypothetical protein [Streptomyces sp. NPDC058671]|uniref:hypothetical protein n=1 Tax=Streptomyces sp. NPDC058671 TaxID=3346590 RepID=UPI00364B39F2
MLLSRHVITGTAISADRPAREDAEAALVENYPRLVRLAYLILPPTLGRHRRVLTAHALVQRTLGESAGRPRPARPRPEPVPAPKPLGSEPAPPQVPTAEPPRPRPPLGEVPPPPAPLAQPSPPPFPGASDRPAPASPDRSIPAPASPDRSIPAPASSDPPTPPPALLPGGRGGERAAYSWLRETVVRAALRPPRRFAPAVRLPLVLGLRLFPRAGGSDELALDRALAGAVPGTRAALALRTLERLPEEAVGPLLARAGLAEPDVALRAAELLAATSGADIATLLGSAEFDPCTVHTRPTDLLRRHRRERLAALAGAVLLVTTAAVTTVELRSGNEPGGRATGSVTALSAAALARALDPAALVRAPAERWADISRVDFTAWPARGTRTGDTALLRRALDAWSRGGDAEVRLSATPGTPTSPPAEPPRLLYAGTVDGTVVVLLHDGRRLARYAASVDGRGPAVLDLARVDDADVTTAAAVVLTRTPGQARYLLAPWIAEAAVRDLRTPGSAARPLEVTPEGLTAAVPYEGAGGCAGVTALQLTSSARIVEDHAFLLADLGELTPVHLTWTPGPGTGAPARAPREATGERGLAAWAPAACWLAALHGTGVRSVNRWEYAEQPLPERAGRALWVCSRVDTWEGSGRISVSLTAPADRAGTEPRTVTELPDTAACSRFGQHVLAGAYRTAPSGTRYFLAAGSRRLTGVTADGAVTARTRGPVLSTAADAADGPVRLTGSLPDGSAILGWTTPTGRTATP